MRVVFRADAGCHIGLGHVMRCLTLADALTEEGWWVHFLCREHQGNAADLIAARGFAMHSLGPGLTAPVAPSGPHDPAHAHWLGVDWYDDAAATEQVLAKLGRIDLLVVDHYALDHRWEQYLRGSVENILVIDDLADRHHDADWLLDQTFGRGSEDYLKLIPPSCQLLLGSNYALLRPEFAMHRERSLARRTFPVTCANIFISLGGFDHLSVTLKILDALRESDPARIGSVMVVLPNNTDIASAATALRGTVDFDLTLKRTVSNMAELMTVADMAIGAAGTTTWERCTLGLPTLLVIMARNQRLIAHSLEKHGACQVICEADRATVHDIQSALGRLLSEPSRLSKMSATAASICDGRGRQRVIEIIGKT